MPGEQSFMQFYVNISKITKVYIFFQEPFLTLIQIFFHYF